MVQQKRRKVKRSRTKKSKGAIFLRRSKAAKKGWETRRKRQRFPVEAAQQISELKQTIKRLETLLEQSKTHEIEVEKERDRLELAKAEADVFIREMIGRIPSSFLQAQEKEQFIPKLLKQTYKVMGAGPALYDMVEALADYYETTEREIWKMYDAGMLN